MTGVYACSEDSCEVLLSMLDTSTPKQTPGWLVLLFESYVAKLRQHMFETNVSKLS